jgi:membrane protein
MRAVPVSNGVQRTARIHEGRTGSCCVAGELLWMSRSILKNLGRVLSETYSEWDRHDAMRMAAALAFYSILSIAPLVILTIAIIGLVYGHSSAQERIADQVESLVGGEGRTAVLSLIESAHKPSSGIVASVTGVCTLLFGASGVFTELRSALNRIWEVDVMKSSGIRGLILDRFFSFGMVLGIGFLLLVSLILSAGLAAIGKWFGGMLPLPEFVLSAINFLVSFTGIAVLFSLIFKFVPQAKIPWQDVWIGAIATSFLFSIGKLGIGLYLGKAGVASAYGAAGSIIVVIVWVYYSALIFFFGAEFTHVLSGGKKRDNGLAALPPQGS